MSQYDQMITRERKWMLYLLAIFVLGAAFTPYVRIFLGLLLGGAVSFYNLFLLQKKTQEFAKAAASKDKPRGIGMISRFAAAIIAVMIALRFEEYFHIVAVIIGLMTSYPVIIIEFFCPEKG
ncbi:ATP synthase subunit I [Virgibacillus sp. 179-BFC.A HS]|uniref:ATP synthase subunit I n=1 Tax=Tigheibacillus jepli TaxID=3035914 RepID=A0ABU5CE23_9BACI|nr:ATP synthase subunit I [Virgibacillus sp. 179-BFC.A HS]MDY0404563.1 ATP synthase subunit I [Virgibacillus sp. 179-BFC.A HS]